MPEDTAVVENPTAEVATPEVAQEEVKFEVPFPSGRSLTTVQGIRSKGRGAGKPFVYFDFTDANVLDAIRKEVGEENWKRELTSFIREKCNDATADALAEAKDGNMEDTVWARKFLEQWVPSTRRSGVGVKQLREKMAELFGELNPLLIKQTKTPSQMTPDETNRLLTLLSDYSDLNEKVEERSRKGKGKKAAAAAK